MLRVRYSLLISWIVLFISILQIAHNLLPQLRTGEFIDYQVYQNASYAFIRGQNPYTESPDGLPFLYPAGSLLFFSLFILTAGTQSIWIFTILSFVAFLASTWILLRIIKDNPKLSDDNFFYSVTKNYFLETWLIVTAFLLQTFPVKFTLSSGQVNHFVLYLLVLGLYFSAKKQHQAGALFLGVSAALKVYPVLLFIPYILKKKWYEAFIVVGCLVLSIGVLPVHAVKYFTTVLSPKLNIDTSVVTTAADQSLTALLLRTGASPIAVSSVVIVSILIFLLLSIRITKNTTLLQLQTVLLPLIMVGAHPVWSHQLVLIYPFFLFWLSLPEKIVFWVVLALPLPASESSETFLYLRASLLPVLLLFTFSKKILCSK